MGTVVGVTVGMLVGALLAVMSPCLSETGDAPVGTIACVCQIL